MLTTKEINTMKKNKLPIHITRESQIRNINKIVNNIKPAFKVEYRSLSYLKPMTL